MGKDSYLCTSESNGEIGILKDDSIKNYLSKINSESTFLGLIDCCHSGTMFDCDYVFLPNKINSNKCKSSKINYLLHNYSYEYEIKKSKYTNSKHNIKGNVILISAARDNQYSYESFKNGKTQGNFTYNSCRLLKKCNKQSVSIEEFLLVVCGMINDEKQLTLCSSSYNFDLSKSYIYNAKSQIPLFVKCEDYNKNEIIKEDPIAKKVDEKPKNKYWSQIFSNIFRSSRSSDNKFNTLPYLISTLAIYSYYKKNN